MVDAQFDPQAGRVDQAQHRLAGHHGAARFGIAGGHHCIGWGKQAHVVALLRQGGALGLQAGLVLASSGGVGQRSLHSRLGRGLCLHVGIERAGADEVLLCQILVAQQGGIGQCSAGSGIAYLGFRGRLRAGRTRQGRIQRSQALAKVHRVHLGQQLPGFDPVTHIHFHRQHPACHSGTHHPAAPGFDCANAKNGGAQSALVSLRHRHLDRCQRAGAQRHVGDATDQHSSDCAQHQAAFE